MGPGRDHASITRPAQRQRQLRASRRARPGRRQLALRCLAVGAAAAAAALPTATAASASSGPQYWVAPTGTTGAQNTSLRDSRRFKDPVGGHRRADDAKHRWRAGHRDLPGHLHRAGHDHWQHGARPGPPVRAAAARSPSSFPRRSAATRVSGCPAPTARPRTQRRASQAPQSVIEICSAQAGRGQHLRHGRRRSTRSRSRATGRTAFCYDSLYGILVEGGAALSLSHSSVSQIGAVPAERLPGRRRRRGRLSPTGQIGHASSAATRRDLPEERHHDRRTQVVPRNLKPSRSPATGRRRPDRAERHPVLVRCHRLGHRQRDQRQQLHRHRRRVLDRHPGWSAAAAQPAASATVLAAGQVAPSTATR